MLDWRPEGGLRSLVAVWRVSARRTRADWPIVAAAWLVMLLAAALFAAGFIYPSAAAEAGLRRALADAPAGDRNIAVSRYGSATEASGEDGDVEAALQAVEAPVGGAIVRDWRVVQTFALSGLRDTHDRAILGVLDGLPDHTTLVAGAWPTEAADPTQPVQVAVAEPVATQLQLHVGQALSLAGDAVNQPLSIGAQVVGIFSITTPDDPYWSEDSQLLTGQQQSGDVRFYGPFVTTREDLLSHAGSASIHLQWRAFPRFDQLAVEDVPTMRARVEGLPGRLESATGATFQLATGLAAILGTAERSLLVSGTGVWLLMAQLAILAGYAIVLTATLLVDHRRIDTALLRSRGAGALQVALLALGEGLVLAIPAVVLGPWLAVGALSALNVVGPLADVGLKIAPRVTTDAYAAATAGGAACVALLVLPVALAARAFAGEHAGLSRQETRTFGQRVGIDVALLAVTGIALWQLRLYGAPLTRTVQGSLGFDPLLVAAPAIGLLAGGVVALRILPRLAQAIESSMSRGRGLVSSLSSRQLARRPLRYTRSALLLMLAVSMGTFAVSYGATWSGSQRDQAAYQSGADVRLLTGRVVTDRPPWALPGAIAGLEGVAVSSPVERIPGGVSFAGGSAADLLALDAGTAADVVLMRPDEAQQPIGSLMQALRASRPEPALAQLPSGAAYLRVVPRIDITRAVKSTFDPVTGEDHSVEVPPRSVVGIRAQARAVIRDGRGLLYQVSSDLLPVDAPGAALSVPLQPLSVPGGAGVDGSSGYRLVGPVELAAVGLELWLPDLAGPGGDFFSAGAQYSGVFGVTSASAGAGQAGPWTEVPLAGGAGWSARMAQGTGVLTEVPADQAEGTAVLAGGEGELGSLSGNGDRAASASFSFVADSVGPPGDGLPVIVNRAFATSSGKAAGDSITARLDGVDRRLAIVGVVDSFPTTDPARPLLVVDEPTLGLARLAGSSTVRGADEWWLAAAGGDADALAGAIGGSSLRDVGIVSVADRTRSLSTDPVALGIIGILSLGFVATGLFASVALTMSAAVSARQRRTEFALLRALGLSGRQLSGTLWLENGSLVAASLVGGTGLGLLIGWLVLPFVTVTQQATTPIPPVLVHVPWDRIALLDAATALTLGVAVIVLGTVLRRLGVGSILRMGED